MPVKPGAFAGVHKKTLVNALRSSAGREKSSIQKSAANESGAPKSKAFESMNLSEVRVVVSELRNAARHRDTCSGEQLEKMKSLELMRAVAKATPKLLHGHGDVKRVHLDYLGMLHDAHTNRWLSDVEVRTLLIGTDGRADTNPFSKLTSAGSFLHHAVNGDMLSADTARLLAATVRGVMCDVANDAVTDDGETRAAFRELVKQGYGKSGTKSLEAALGKASRGSARHKLLEAFRTVELIGDGGAATTSVSKVAKRNDSANALDSSIGEQPVHVASGALRSLAAQPALTEPTMRSVSSFEVSLSAWADKCEAAGKEQSASEFDIKGCLDEIEEVMRALLPDPNSGSPVLSKAVLPKSIGRLFGDPHLMAHVMRHDGANAAADAFLKNQYLVLFRYACLNGAVPPRNVLGLVLGSQGEAARYGRGKQAAERFATASFAKYLFDYSATGSSARRIFAYQIGKKMVEVLAAAVGIGGLKMRELYLSNLIKPGGYGEDGSKSLLECLEKTERAVDARREIRDTLERYELLPGQVVTDQQITRRMLRENPKNNVESTGRSKRQLLHADTVPPLNEALNSAESDMLDAQVAASDALAMRSHIAVAKVEEPASRTSVPPATRAPDAPAGDNKRRGFVGTIKSVFSKVASFFRGLFGAQHA